jgi:hypothetical protein
MTDSLMGEAQDHPSDSALCDLRSRIHVRGARLSALDGPSGGEPGEEPHPRPHRARVRRAGNRAPVAASCARSGSCGLKVGLQNFVYNIRRLAALERIAAASGGRAAAESTRQPVARGKSSLRPKVCFGVQF